uniref:RING-type domain-containing protein n=1 Tax=Caenorhabditis tropicalis TaxID=1561998 RepID=A0A1I7TPC5_9PELO
MSARDLRNAVRRARESRARLEEARRRNKELRERCEEMKRPMELQKIRMEEIKKERKELLECPVCRESFNTAEKVPSFLACDDTVCGECVKKIVEVAHGEQIGRNRVTIQCPECREGIEVPYPFNPQAYRRNEDLITFMEETQ